MRSALKTPPIFVGTRVELCYDVRSFGMNAPAGSHGEVIDASKPDVLFVRLFGIGGAWLYRDQVRPVTA